MTGAEAHLLQALVASVSLATRASFITGDIHRNGLHPLPYTSRMSALVKSRHVQCTSRCPFCANSRHFHSVG